MAKVEITPHAKERVFSRVRKDAVGDFLKGVREGVGRLPGGPGPWTVMVLKNREVLGLAVGKGLVWETTLSGGMTPDKRSQTVIVKV